MRITFLTREGCHLCEQAQPVVERVCAELDVHLEITDVDADAALARRYTDEVPVVLIDGVQHSMWHVDETRLRRALRG